MNEELIKKYSQNFGFESNNEELQFIFKHFLNVIDC